MKKTVKYYGKTKENNLGRCLIVITGIFPS